MPEIEKTQDTLDRDAMDLHRALSELIRVYQFRDRKRICCHDISVTQCYALETLCQHGSMSLSDLSKTLYLDNSTASRVIDSLERKELARRRADEDDRRVIRIEVTDQGHALYARIEQDLLEQSRRLLADIDEDVRQATARLIARLAKEASRRFSRSDGCCTS